MNKKLLILGSDGRVVQTINGYDIYSFNPVSFSQNVTPLVVDQGLNSTVVNAGFLLPDGTTGTQPTEISPVTEQLVTGSVTGTFALNEQVYQSQYIPQIVNNLVLNGTTATEYNPTVGSIGVSGPELGNRAAKFYGSYLDLNTKAAGIKLPSFSTTSTPYFLISGFAYFESTPSGAYDPILVTRTQDGVNNSTNDSFRLEYDNSSASIQFHFATSNTSSAGLPYILNVCPANGVTMNEWHQFAVAYSNQGGSACASSYWNGVRYNQYTGISGSIRTSTAPLMLGSGVSGDKPLKGWLEHIMISAGGSTLALREFTHGATAPTDPEAQTAGDYTIYALSMNGPLGSSLFPCSNTKRVVGSASFVDQYTNTVGVSNIIRENTSVHGVTLFTGVNGGFTGSDSSGNAGFLFGNDSGACMNISSVTSTISTVEDGRKIRGSLIDHTIAFLTGSTMMRGTCASPADFPTLFAGPSGSFSGRTFSFLPIYANVSALRSIYDDIIIFGRTLSYNLSDFEGNMYVFSTGGVKNLYSDVVAYHSNAYSLGSAVKSTIASTPTLTALTSISGISAEGAVRKLAPQITNNAYLYLDGKSRISKKTAVPEKSVAEDLGDSGPLGGEGFGGGAGI